VIFLRRRRGRSVGLSARAIWGSRRTTRSAAAATTPWRWTNRARPRTRGRASAPPRTRACRPFPTPSASSPTSPSQVRPPRLQLQRTINHSVDSDEPHARRVAGGPRALDRARARPRTRREHTVHSLLSRPRLVRMQGSCSTTSRSCCCGRACSGTPWTCSSSATAAWASRPSQVRPNREPLAIIGSPW
jgi:hypothetical protein